MLSTLSSSPLTPSPPPPSSTSLKNPKPSSIKVHFTPLPPHLKHLLTTLSSSSPSPSQLNQLHALLVKSPSPLPLLNSSLHHLLSSTTTTSSSSAALQLFLVLRLSNLLPDPLTCSLALKACSRLSLLSLASSTHALLLKLSLLSDPFLLNSLLHFYASSALTPSAALLFHLSPSRDPVSFNIMITHYAKMGLMDSARHLFDEMPHRTVTSWTSMIAGYAQHNRPAEAIRLFHLMEASGARPNDVTAVAILSACADLGELELGQRVHDYAVLRGYHHNVRVCNTLIDMYIKCGCLDAARTVFNRMRRRTVVSWSAMIGGLAMHGRGEEALELFAEMTRLEVKPNNVTFIGILHACSHMGLLDEGQRYFASMSRDYGIAPHIEHYGCMVDLLSRAGRLKEAHQFIKSMPIEPNNVVWGALLGGCRVHKNVELAEEVIKHCLRLSPHNDGYYVVLSNIYADAGRWDDAARVRRLMRERGVRKTPGWSTITVDGVVHEFLAGDGEHPRARDIYEEWDRLVGELKERGYVPNTSVVPLDMGEEEKVKVLYRHSEKLAAVFGLLNTSPGTPLRIIKNLRVCGDCHSTFKLLSIVANRRIVVRDRNRFHSFENGSCSCRDYW